MLFVACCGYALTWSLVRRLGFLGVMELYFRVSCGLLDGFVHDGDPSPLVVGESSSLVGVRVGF